MNAIQHTATRKDVAREAGVSETIVSYVLNNNRPVSADKRKRVMEAVRRLNYRPNAIARALKGKGNSQLLFIVDNIANEYFGRLMQDFNAIAYNEGYLVSLMETVNSREFVSRILSRQVDGVVISSTILDGQYIQALIDSGLPTVLLMVRDYENLTGRFARLYTGIEPGIMAAVRALSEQGRRHIVYVDRVSANGHFSSERDPRYRGFCRQMAALGYALPESSFVSGCTDFDALSAAITARIASGVPVDAFVCRNDRIACTVLKAAQSAGRRVPEDVAVVGYDNSDLSRFSTPQLTSVMHDQADIAHGILSLTEALIRGEAPADWHSHARLILRQST